MTLEGRESDAGDEKVSFRDEKVSLEDEKVSLEMGKCRLRTGNGVEMSKTVESGLLGSRGQKCRIVSNDQAHAGVSESIMSKVVEKRPGEGREA